MTEDLISRGEIADWLRNLLQTFHMEEGYPATYVINSEGEHFGVVGEPLGSILEEGLEILSALQEELGVSDEDVEYGFGTYDIEFEFDDDGGDED